MNKNNNKNNQQLYNNIALLKKVCFEFKSSMEDEENPLDFNHLNHFFADINEVLGFKNYVKTAYGYLDVHEIKKTTININNSYILSKSNCFLISDDSQLDAFEVCVLRDLRDLSLNKAFNICDSLNNNNLVKEILKECIKIYRDQNSSEEIFHITNLENIIQNKVWNMVNMQGDGLYLKEIKLLKCLLTISNICSNKNSLKNLLRALNSPFNQKRKHKWIIEKGNQILPLLQNNQSNDTWVDNSYKEFDYYYNPNNEDTFKGDGIFISEIRASEILLNTMQQVFE